MKQKATRFQDLWGRNLSSLTTKPLKEALQTCWGKEGIIMTVIFPVLYRKGRQTVSCILYKSDKLICSRAAFESGDFSSVQFSRSVMSNSLRPHESQHARPPYPSPSPRVYSDSCPSSWWCHPAICHPLLLLTPIPIRIFPNESTLCMR